MKLHSQQVTKDFENSEACDPGHLDSSLSAPNHQRKSLILKCFETDLEYFQYSIPAPTRSTCTLRNKSFSNLMFYMHC